MSSPPPHTPISRLERLNSIARAWHMIEDRSAELHLRYDREVGESPRLAPEVPQAPQTPILRDLSNFEAQPRSRTSLGTSPETPPEASPRDEVALMDQAEDPLEVKTSVGHFTSIPDYSEPIHSAPSRVTPSIPSITEQYESIDLSRPDLAWAPPLNTPLNTPLNESLTGRHHFGVDRDFEGARSSTLGFNQSGAKRPGAHTSGASLWSREGFTPVPSVPHAQAPHTQSGAQLIPPQSTHDVTSYTPVSQWGEPHGEAQARASYPSQDTSHHPSQGALNDKSQHTSRFEALMSVEAPQEELEAFTSVAERLMRAQGRENDEVSSPVSSRDEPDSSRPTSFDSMYPSASPPPHTLGQSSLASQGTLVSAPERLKTRAQLPWRLIVCVSLVSVALGALIVYYSRAF